LKVGNLRAIDVLIYSRHFHLITLEQAVLKQFGVRNIESARGVSLFKENLKHVYRDIVILNHYPEMNIANYTRLVRDENASMNPFAIILLVTPSPSASLLKSALGGGVDGVIAMPFTSTDLWRQLAGAVNRSRTFVRTEQYFGPDRRRLKNVPYSGELRRDEDD